MSSRKRVTWVDVTKYICIMCIMNAHLESCTYLLVNMYAPFVISLFFFCSGYVYSPKDNFQNFTKKKISQLFKPWLVFSVLNIVMAAIFSFNEHSSLISELFWNFLQIRGYGDGLWFVAALFVTYFPFFFCIRWYEENENSAKIWTIVAFTWILSLVSDLYAVRMNPAMLPWNSVALPWHLQSVFGGMFYMVLGYLFRTKFEVVFDKYNTVMFRIGIFVSYFITLIIGNCTDTSRDYVLNLLGIVAVVSISKILPANKMVLYLGQNTLLCFALHGKVYSLLQLVCRKVIPNTYNIILNNMFYSTIFSIIFTIVLSLILIIPIWFINRYFPFLLGRSLQKNKRS